MALNIAPDGSGRVTLMTGVMSGVVCDIRQAKRTQQRQSERYAKNRRDKAKKDGEKRYRADNRHYISAGVLRILVMTAMQKEHEGPYRGQPPIEVEEKAMHKVLEEGPRQHARHDDERRLSP